MKEKVLIPGLLTDSDTRYAADRSVYEVYQKDCFHVTNPYCVNYFYSDLKAIDSAFYAEDLKNVTLDFGGATVNLHGLLQPISLYRCENVTLANVNLQYERGLYSEALVLEATPTYARVRFGKNNPCRCENGRLIPYADEWEDDHLFERQMFFQFFNAATGDGEGITLGIVGPELPEGMDLFFHPFHYVAEQDGEDVIFRAADPNEPLPDAWHAGAIVAIEHGGRFFPGIILQSCQNVTLENVRLINTNSMGILPLHTKDLYIRGLRMMRDEASKGLLTNSADAIHAITNSGNFVVEDSIMEDMMDDAMNVHGQFQLVETCVGNKLTVRITARSITQYCNLCDVGDEIAVYRENTMVPRTVCHVTACRILDTYRAELTLDTEPVGVCTDDMVENLSGNCDLTLRRCRFAKANTHLRFQTRGKVLVEDCVTELPFWLTGDATFWYESSPCTDFTVKNTYFIKKAAIIKSCPQVRVCPEAPYYHKNVTVTDCVFTNDTPLSLCYTDNVRFLNNRHVLGDAMQIHAQNCGVIEAPGCTIERETSEQVLGNN